MKQYMLAFAAVATLAVGAVSTANAVEVGVGPNGVYVDHDRPYYRDRDRDYGRNCRVVIDHHTNRFGEDVSVRKRICD